jgi:hypothetical protein
MPTLPPCNGVTDVDGAYLEKASRNPSMLHIRTATKATVLATNTLTVRSAQQRLAELQPAKKPTKSRK